MAMWLHESEYHVFTDGSADERRAGWAFVVVRAGEILGCGGSSTAERDARQPGLSSLEAESLAVISALEWGSAVDGLVSVYCDNAAVVVRPQGFKCLRARWAFAKIERLLGCRVGMRVRHLADAGVVQTQFHNLAHRLGNQLRKGALSHYREANAEVRCLIWLSTLTTAPMACAGPSQ